VPGPTSHLLYLHGFRSSPRSTKARQMAAWVERHHPQLTWLCPQLPASPRAALRLILERTATWPPQRMALIGSSLGGFYATVAAERLGCQAVLLNPAVEPARDLADQLGQSRAWHSDEPFHFGAEDVAELAALRPRAITRPERYYAVVAKGDELLDWREITARYAGCTVRLLEGGDHALSDFEAHLPGIAEFLGLAVERRDA
jgi:uncharacterized protein